MLRVYVVLDRSGSMSSMWAEALSGVNTYVADLARNGIEGHVKVIAFDSQNPNDVIRDCNIDAFTNIQNTEVSPRGGTPLYDAAGSVIAEAEALGSERTSIVIITDGHDTGCREFTREAVVASVARCEERGWEVLFLGANFDAAAHNFTTNVDFTMNTNTANFGQTMAYASTRSAVYATTGNIQQISDEDRARLGGNNE